MLSFVQIKLTKDNYNITFAALNLMSGGIKMEENKNTQIQESTENGAVKRNRCLPSFIRGLVASLFGIMGGLCTTMCDSLISNGVAPFILIVGGSVVGLVGACLCMNKAKIGSILQFVAAIMIIICAYGVTGAEFMTIFAMILFIVSGIVGVVFAFVVNRK